MATDRCTCRECLEAEEFSFPPPRGDGRAPKIFTLLVFAMAIVAMLTRSAHAQIRYTDENGQSHWVQEERQVPEQFRGRITRPGLPHVDAQTQQREPYKPYQRPREVEGLSEPAVRSTPPAPERPRSSETAEEIQAKIHQEVMEKKRREANEAAAAAAESRNRMLAYSLIVVGLLTWVGGAAAVGQAADRKGRAFLSFFLLSVILSPIPTAFAVACMRPEKA